MHRHLEHDVADERQVPLDPEGELVLAGCPADTVLAGCPADTVPS
jgi:hypothetical protein